MTNQEWKALIEAKHEEIEKAISEATEKALNTGDRITVTLDWNGEVDTCIDPAHGMFDFGFTRNDLIEIATIDFGTYQLEGTKEGRI